MPLLILNGGTHKYNVNLSTDRSLAKLDPSQPQTRVSVTSLCR